MRRLQRELQTIIDQYHFDVELEDDDLYKWIVAIHGPDDTPYFGGTFLVSIIFPRTYPLDKPSVKLLTKIFHPNITLDGKVCIAMIDTWRPEYTSMSIIDTILSLLKTPDPTNPLVPEIGVLYRTDQDTYNDVAGIWTARYAI